MNDEQLLRYSRHILLPDIGIEGQQKLHDAHALIIGAGGLGSPVALYLAASGVGTLTLVDDDTVDLTNLQRQIIHRTSSVGMPKVDSARASLGEINPDVRVRALNERADRKRLLELVAQADIVIDCSDNFATRYALNQACVELKKPFVSGAATRFDGQVAVFDMRQASSPCYHCLYPEQSDALETRCAIMGVLAPLVGIIGSMQAAEALKVLVGMGTPLCGRLLVMDALHMELRTVKLSRDPACPVCSTR
ncbi:MAG: molybdopterin-synthase adenylyltransferase MoeB [Candidatus Nitrotoga sp.]|nr:molybdopterin-synthase adenylyltransferase MoeB [Candidatus Nitrotoga sp.]MDW7604384.1 molybdopterin-synthase adenylyltransferase MoeB [Candidatus Nitrotoga sp.]MDW7612369.1 molybdopterin-synthase adenylyltransferase MoeB [Candidatus Nitrotoga sp.]MDW7625786.1 molybdopterin-synthase adenylyltransferase MoeB [Candidatus Nitrotoga sp.]